MLIVPFALIAGHFLVAAAGWLRLLGVFGLVPPPFAWKKSARLGKTENDAKVKQMHLDYYKINITNGNKIATAAQPSSIWDKGKLFLKAIIIFPMALALWIPTYFIMGLVKSEREARQWEHHSDISSKWGGKQTVTGPMLVLPLYRCWKDGSGNITTVKRNAYFMADQFADKVQCYSWKEIQGYLPGGRLPEWNTYHVSLGPCGATTENIAS